MKGIQRHEQWVAKLEKDLLHRNEYDLVGTHLHYFDGRKELGEIDIYGVDMEERRMDIYEVKCSTAHQERARAQLKRAKSFFSPHFDMISIYAYLNGELKEVH
jgi:hypothetical protein